MGERRLERTVSVASVIAALVITACSGSATTAPPGSPTALPGTPTPSVAPSASDKTFSLAVVPAEPVGKLFSGSPYVLLVTASGVPADGAVQLTASAKNATVTIEPESVSPGMVAEVTVVPDRVSTEQTLQVALTGTRGGAAAAVGRTLTVTPETDQLGPEAATYFSRFTSWLAANRPDLGITNATEWHGLPGAWVLVVSHYLYMSKDWEAGLAWHVMVPPDDWATLYLRHRWTEATPSLAFKISSVSGGVEPAKDQPPDAVWR